MSDIQAAVSTPWGDAAEMQDAVLTPWGDATDMQSVGSTYVPPAVGGGTVITPGSLLPGIDVLPATSYAKTVAVVVKDLRDDTVLNITSVTVAFGDGSTMWSLDAEGDASVAIKMRSGEQPATVSVQIGTDKWAFVIEKIDQPMTFGRSGATLRGRSLAALAGEPYQLQQQWLADAPTTAAQVCVIAQTFTDLDVQFNADDWLIGAGEWSATTDPLGVVTNIAAAIQADVEADPEELRVTVRPRYAIPPNAWATTPPDWQFPWVAVESAEQERADQPEYDSVVVASSGLALLCRLAGTSGSRQAPLVSDTRLTDTVALRQRAESMLFGYGKQVRETRTLQIHQRAVRRGELVRFVEPDGTWVGMVRGVSISATLGKARQTITMERRTAFISGVYVPPAPPLPTDPLFAQVVCLLHFNESPGATTLLDSSSYGASITLPGAGLEISNAAPKWGSASLLVNRRNGDPIVLTGSRFDRAAGQPFSIQWYAKKVATDNATNTPSYVQVINGGFGGTVFYVAQYYSPGITNVIQVFFSGFTNIVLPAGIEDAQGYVFYTLNVNASNILTLHANGTLVFTGASACGAWAGGGLYLGGPPGGVSGITTENYMDEFRFTMGATRDPSPPVAPFPDYGP